MNVLGLDTCFGALSVALGLGLGTPRPVVLSRMEPMATGHAERLVPLLGELIDEAGISLAGIDRIAVTNGPGSFTGTRICIAAARALHLAHGTPVVAISSLQAMALHAGLGDIAPGTGLIIAVDAHRGEAYVQHFEGVTREALSPPQIIAEAEFGALGGDGPVVIGGTASKNVAEAIRSAGGMARTIEAGIWPAMDKAVVRAVNLEPSATPVAPLYLRPPDAKPQDGKSLARVHSFVGTVS